jgi:hypothetical protein
MSLAALAAIFTSGFCRGLPSALLTARVGVAIGGERIDVDDSQELQAMKLARDAIPLVACITVALQAGQI